jgi:hypothetical protein
MVQQYCSFHFYNKPQIMNKNLLIIALAVFGSFSLALNIQGCKSVTTPVSAAETACTFSPLTLNEVTAMVRNYKENQWAAFNPKLQEVLSKNASPEAAANPQDARSVLFKLDTLGAFLCAIRKMVENDTIINAEGSRIRSADVGIRIYYASYPAQPDEILRKTSLNRLADHPKARHTVIFVPAYFSKREQTYIDFDPVQKSKDGTLTPITDRQYNRKQPGTFMTLEMPARNQGQLCPPPTDCLTDIMRMADENTDEEK